MPLERGPAASVADTDAQIIGVAGRSPERRRGEAGCWYPKSEVEPTRGPPAPGLCLRWRWPLGGSAAAQQRRRSEGHRRNRRQPAASSPQALAGTGSLPPDCDLCGCSQHDAGAIDAVLGHDDGPIAGIYEVGSGRLQSAHLVRHRVGELIRGKVLERRILCLDRTGLLLLFGRESV